MLKIEINPQNLKTEILKNLNICFPGWGGEVNYNWYFERAVTHLSPDVILIRNEDHEIIAGSAISYRKMKWSNNKTYDIGIMTGSWTLPAARGRGCFTEMINTSLKICRDKQVDFLTAFVTENNASYRRLKEAGSYCLPTNNYSFTNEDLNPSLIEVKEIGKSEWESILGKADKHYDINFGFNYSKGQFAQQYLYRLHEIKCFEYNQQIYIVETTHVTKILFVSHILNNELEDMMHWLKLKYHKKVWFFSSNSKHFVDLGKFLEVTPGYFTMLATTDKMFFNTFEQELKTQMFNIQLGDKV